MKLRNFAGLALCAAVFCALASVNVWFAVSFVAAAIGLVALAFCYGAFKVAHIFHRSRHCDVCNTWYGR